MGYGFDCLKSTQILVVLMSIQKPFTSALIEILAFSQPASLMRHYAESLPAHGFELVVLGSPRELFLKIGLQQTPLVLLSCPLAESYMLASRIRLMNAVAGLIVMADFKGPDERVRALQSGQPGWRKLGMGLIALATLKAFVYDASELDGLLRVFGFLAMGLALAGLAWVNRWVMARERGSLETSDQQSP